MLSKELNKHRAEFTGALRKRRFEETPQGIFFPDQKVYALGAYTHSVNGQDEQTDPNVVTTEGLTYLLGSGLDGATQITSWYLALFEGNVTPGAGVTGATFAAACTEFTDYDEANRVLMIPGAVTASLSNTADRAVFTMSAGVSNQTIYGSGLLQSSVKAGVTGKCFSAARYATTRTGLNEGDELLVTFAATLVSA
jgi:hypothetical protein